MEGWRRGSRLASRICLTSGITSKFIFDAVTPQWLSDRPRTTQIPYEMTAYRTFTWVVTANGAISKRLEFGWIEALTDDGSGERAKSFRTSHTASRWSIKIGTGSCSKASLKRQRQAIGV